MANPRRGRAAPWLVMGPYPYFATCLRCGFHEAQPALPMDADAFLNHLAAVIARHADCAPPSAQGVTLDPPRGERAYGGG